MSVCKDVCNFSFTNTKNVVVQVVVRSDDEVYWVMEGPRYVGEFANLDEIENYFYQNYSVDVDLSKFKVDLSKAV